jgi:nicotinamidase-related amidase
VNIPTYDKEITALLVVGYEVTVIKDATADYSDEMMRAALKAANKRDCDVRYWPKADMS